MSVFGMKTFCMTPKSLLLKIKIIGLTTRLRFSNLLYAFLDLLCLKVVIRHCLSIFLVLYFIVLYFLVFYSQRSRIFISCPIYDNLFSIFHNLTKFFNNITLPIPLQFVAYSFNHSMYDCLLI